MYRADYFIEEEYTSQPNITSNIKYDILPSTKLIIHLLFIFYAEATPYTLTEIVNKLTSDTRSSPTDINSAIGYTFSPEPFTYTHRDVILYALGSKFVR